ncbi:hypothetical protein WMY93_024198 [Mugilogobius chulae]|uniref:Uncharacterized protein n=1 Tax=Mugilogobius chulae TaxID=88201 RepID=A0AAW0MZZ2_9GOBI
MRQEDKVCPSCSSEPSTAGLGPSSSLMDTAHLGWSQLEIISETLLSSTDKKFSSYYQDEGAFQLSCTWSSLLQRPPSDGGLVSPVDLTGPLAGTPRNSTWEQQLIRHNA